MVYFSNTVIVTFAICEFIVFSFDAAGLAAIINQRIVKLRWTWAQYLEWMGLY